MEQEAEMRSDIQKRADALMREGFDAIKSQDLDRALEIGRELRECRHSSTFEISALAYCAKGDLRRAIRVLEEGVERAPFVWRLWELLGNYYSDQGRFADARECYRKALKCSSGDNPWVHLNAGICFLRQGKFRDALREADRIGNKAFGLKKVALRIEALSGLGRAREVEALVRKVLGRKWKGADPEDVAHVYAVIGEVRLKQGKTEEATRLARDAIAVHRQSRKAAWLLREIGGKRSPRGKYYRVMVSGTWNEPAEGGSGPLGFFTNYDVVADDRREAMKLLRQFESPDVRKSLRLESCKVLEKRPRDPKGVYRTWGYYCYPKRRRTM